MSLFSFLEKVVVSRIGKIQWLKHSCGVVFDQKIQFLINFLTAKNIQAVENNICQKQTENAKCLFMEN